MVLRCQLLAHIIGQGRLLQQVPAALLLLHQYQAARWAVVHLSAVVQQRSNAVTILLRHVVKRQGLPVGSFYLMCHGLLFGIGGAKAVPVMAAVHLLPLKGI